MAYLPVVSAVPVAGRRSRQPLAQHLPEARKSNRRASGCYRTPSCRLRAEVSHLPEIDPEKLRPRMLPHNPKDLKSPMGATVKHRIRREEGLAAASLHEQVPQRRRKLARSEEHTSELQSLMRNSYAVFCLKKTKL